MRMSYWSSDVCSSDLDADRREHDEGESLPEQHGIHGLNRPRFFFFRPELGMAHQNEEAPRRERQPLQADEQAEHQDDGLEQEESRQAAGLAQIGRASCRGGVGQYG